MNSFQKSTDYNIYRLDTVTGKWSYLGKDEVLTDDYNKSLVSLPEVPPAPQKAGEYSFSIGDDTGQYPELKAYENILFEPVDNNDCVPPPGGFHATEINVKDLGKGIFEVTFIIDGYNGAIHEESRCKCYLAFKEGVDYDSALNVYQDKYKKQIERRDRAKKKLEAEWKNYLDAKQEYEKLGLLDLFNKKEVAGMTGKEKITRTLEISGFGFINCDIPTAYPQGAELIAKFKDTQGKELKLSNIVLVEKGRNALFRYQTKIKFNPQRENILWGITSDNKLAFFKPGDFEKIEQTTGEYTFTMNICSETLKTYEDICKVLFN